ncbi:MAG: protease complex subunit PrcB family protein [Steroidobacteraceae bacterium]
MRAWSIGRSRFTVWLLAPTILCGCVLAAAGPLQLRRPVAALQLQNTGYESPAQLVIVDAATWRSAWARLAYSQRPMPPAPEVDFAKDIVVIVAMGRQRSGGYSVKILSADRTDKGVSVLAVLHEPGRGCINTQAITAPADMVVLPATAGPISFDIRREKQECG